jgi:hypothetical protein
MGSIPNGSAPLQACARQIFKITLPGRTGKAQVRNRPGMSLSQIRHRRTHRRMGNGAGVQGTKRHGKGSTPTGAHPVVPASAAEATSKKMDSGGVIKKMDSGGVSATGPSAQPPFRAEVAEAIRRPRRTLAGRANRDDGNTVGVARGVVLLNRQGLGGGKTRGRRARSDRGSASNRTRTVRRRKAIPARTSSPTRPAARIGGRSGAATAGRDPGAGAGKNHGRVHASNRAVGRNGSLRHGGGAGGVMRVGIQRSLCNSKRTMRIRRRDFPLPTTACQSGTRT